MGARSAVYALYYFAMAAIVFSVMVAIWVGIVPQLPTCSNLCPVEVLVPGRYVGGRECPTNPSYAAQYASNCFACDGATVTWPCPAGVGDCRSDEDRRAATCIGQNNATTLTGQPIVYDLYLTVVPADFQRCRRALGETPSSTDTTACPRCIAAGRCANANTFTGPGTFISGDGVTKLLCFTTPLRVLLRPLMVPGIYLFLVCYLVITMLLLINGGILCGFRGVKGRGWALQGLWQSRFLCLARIVPHILRWLNVLLLAMLLLASVAFWAFGVCTDAVDRFGEALLQFRLQSSLIVSLVFFFLTCCGGGIMRTFIAPDAPFMDVEGVDAPEMTEDDGGGGSGGLPRPGGRAGSRAATAAAVSTRRSSNSCGACCMTSCNTMWIVFKRLGP